MVPRNNNSALFFGAQYLPRKREFEERFFLANPTDHSTRHS